MVAAVLVRVAVIAASLHYPYNPSTDFKKEILPLVKNLIAGHGFTLRDTIPWAWKGPLYPLLTAFFVFFFGEQFMVQRVFMVFLDLMCIPLIMKLGRLVFNTGTGLAAGFLWAFYVPSIWVAAILNYEAVTTILLLLSLYLLLVKGLVSWRWAAAAGLILSLATLCRASTLLLGPFLVFLGLFQLRKYKGVFSKLCLFAFVSLVGVLPWTIRNYQRFHVVIPVALSGSSSLFWGSEKAFLTEMDKKYVLVEERLATLGFPGELSIDPIVETRQFKEATLRNYARQWQENPWQLVDLYVTKLTMIFFYSDSGRWDQALMFLNLPIVILSLWGVWTLRRNMSFNMLVLFGTMLYFWLFHLPFHIFFRFLLPVFPCFVLFASYCGERLWSSHIRQAPRNV